MPKASETHVGLQLLTSKGMNHVARRVYLERVVEAYLSYNKLGDGFYVTMPCGEQYIFNEKNIPSDITLCRCKDPRHIVVLWRFVTDGMEGEH